MITSFNRAEPFIEEHHKQLMKLYETTEIKTFLVKQKSSSKRTYTKVLACQQLGDLRLHSTEPFIFNLISSKDNIVIYNVLLALAKMGDIDNLAKALVSNPNEMRLSFRAIIEVMTVFKGSKVAKELLFKKTIESSDDYLKGILIKAATDGQFEGLSDYYIKVFSIKIRSNDKYHHYDF